MKAFRIFGRSIIDSFKSVGRNFSLSLASISCISITLILVAISIILSYNVNNFTSSIEKDVTIVVFVETDATENELDVIKNQILNIPNVDDKKLVFKSKSEVKNDMSKESDIFENILSGYTEETNPLQNTFQVKVHDIEQIGETANEIESFNGVEVVKYGEGMVEELVKIFEIVKNVTYGVVVALVIVTAFLISNTIKITISNRKREIEIMRLVGASNSYIKTPFFFEGIILGIIGSIVPIFACCYGYVYLYNVLGGKLFTEIIKLVNPDLIIMDIILFILLVAVIVGGFGSYRAVRKYLKI